MDNKLQNLKTALFCIRENREKEVAFYKQRYLNGMPIIEGNVHVGGTNIAPYKELYSTENNKKNTSLKNEIYVNTKGAIEPKDESINRNTLHQEYLKRRAFLTLELPFKTDPFSIMAARGAVYNTKSQKRRQKLQKTADEVLDEWIDSNNNRRCFLNILRGSGMFHYRSNDSSEDLAKIFNSESLENFLSARDIEADSVRTYLAIARHLVEFLNKDLLIIPTVPHSAEKSLSLYDAERLFEELELRALKSNAIRAFEDLLLCRAITYIPLPAKKLFFLSSPDKNANTVAYNDKSYEFPSSFLALWECFDIEDRLFPKQLIEKQEKYLHQKVQRLGEYAELSINVTPSVLRKSIIPMCCNYLNIELNVLRQLPRR